MGGGPGCPSMQRPHPRAPPTDRSLGWAPIGIDFGGLLRLVTQGRPCLWENSYITSVASWINTVTLDH